MHSKIIPSMHRRCSNWDYRAPRIYSITITLLDRSRPLLGRLVIDSPPDTSPELIKAHIEPTPLGNIVSGYWHEIASRFPEIKIYGFQLMEEHLHGVLYVKRRLPKHLGMIIGGFKGACTTAYHQMAGVDDPLFSEGFQDTILFQEGQLERMLNYLEDNPRRLAVKRLFPNFFKRLQNIPFHGGFLQGIGNPFLLKAPVYFPIQVSRKISDTEFAHKKEELYQQIEMGSILVSPCISPGERELARLGFEAKAPLVALKNMCFPPLFKPSGAYFDACANGRLLMVAPARWAFTPSRKPITRTDACILNAIAASISGKDLAEIHYAGMTPANLTALLAEAIGAKG